MAKILDMPKLSPTMEEGVLLAWHKQEGDAVNVDDLLAEVETDKATMEFRAFDKGTLLKHLVPAGTVVRLGQAVAVLGDAGEDVRDLVSKAGGGAAPPKGPDNTANPVQEPREPNATRTRSDDAGTRSDDAGTRRGNRGVPVDKGSPLDRTQRDFAEVVAEATEETGSGRALASPYVRKVARERGIDLSATHGSGERGRIVPADLDAPTGGRGSTQLARTSGSALASPPFGPVPASLPAALLAALPASLRPPEVRPLSPMRKTIARRITESKQTVPHFYLTIDVDASAIMSLRETINAQLSGRSPEAEAASRARKGSPNEDGARPDRISMNDLLIKAVAGALVRVPECNAQFTSEALLIHARIDISVAVAIPEGLVTPVVRNADQKSVVAIAREVRDLASRARARKLKPEEMSDGTFSISNLGMFGIDAFSAVINPPEGAILAVGQARDEPVVKGGAVVPGKKMSMTLSCDHRVIDGAVGAAFLAELRALIEQPMRILTG